MCSATSLSRSVEMKGDTFWGRSQKIVFVKIYCNGGEGGVEGSRIPKFFN